MVSLIFTTYKTRSYNTSLAFIAEATIAKALEFGVRPEGTQGGLFMHYILTNLISGVLKTGEVSPGIPKGKQVAPNSNGNADSTITSSPSPFPAWLSDTVELAHTQRGQDWRFGRDAYVIKESRPLERSAFLRSTLKHTLICYLLLDLLANLIKLVPGVGSSYGGSIYLPTLPPIQRYLFGSLLHLTSGVALLAGFDYIYGTFTLVAVGIFQSEPNNWPPVLDEPWKAQSAHELWAKRWHQLLRHAFLVYGGYPGKWIAGRTGMVKLHLNLAHFR